MRIERIGPRDGAKVIRAGPLFDGPARPEATSRFLAEPGHHLLIAYEGDEPAGFISGVEVTHPDKGTEMFLYELAVADAFQRRGIGKALVGALAEIARAIGCYGMFVLTSPSNTAALATYEGAGAEREGEHTMLGWDFTRSDDR